MGHVNNVVIQLRLQGRDIKKKIVEKVLRSMPKMFESMVVFVEEDKDPTQLSLEEFSSSLASHESSMFQYEDNTLENTFKSHVSMSNNKCRRKTRHTGKR